MNVDAIKYLEKANAEGKKFDLIIVDASDPVTMSVSCILSLAPRCMCVNFF
jgi:predicted membrane-bound spermidine synthase